MRQFWGQQQRFFKEMANASKVGFVVEQAKEALASGMSVVVGLQSTGESGMDKVRAKHPRDSIPTKCLPVSLPQLFIRQCHNFLLFVGRSFAFCF